MGELPYMSERWVHNPIRAIGNNHIVDYPTPSNISYLWSYGSLAGMMLVVQLVTGIFPAMHYTAHVDRAFSSVEHIMRDVNYGWLVRYLHANGASFFFIVVYIHIVPRIVLRKLHAPSRAPLGFGSNDLPTDDGHCLHRVRSSVGADVFLGCDRDYKPCFGHSRNWNRNCKLGL